MRNERCTKSSAYPAMRDTSFLAASSAAERCSKDGQPENGIAELDKVQAVKYAAWDDSLKVLRASVSGEASPGAGTRLTVRGCPALGTGAGVLVLEEVQPAGKKPMPGKAFLAGARDWAA